MGIADRELNQLLERSGELKATMVEFADQRRYAADLEEAFEDTLGDKPNPDERDIADAYDYFILQHRLPDGRKLVEHFVEHHPELSAAEQEMVLGWRDVVEGIFAVSRREGDVLILENLLDELIYPTRSNKGRAALNQIPVGSFIIARVVPIADTCWLLSGALQIFPRGSRLYVYRMAAEMALQFPRLAFRNPEKLAQALKIQRENRAAFIELFGGDTIVVPGSELTDLVRRFYRYQTYEWRDETGQTVAERAGALAGEEVTPRALDLDFGELAEADSVGVIFDEVDGMNFFLDYALVADVFTRPDLLDDPAHATTMAIYLEDPDVIPLPLRRLAEQHPTTVNMVFRRVLGRPDFVWQRDGEDMLRVFNPDYYAREQVPAISPLSDKLSAALKQDPLAFRRVGRNDPCPCGSGKKYKRCCGAG